jgi:hypothetical protein
MTRRRLPAKTFRHPLVPVPALLVLFFLFTACGDDGTGAETGTAVTVEGVITRFDGTPAPGLHAHLVYGTLVAPVPVDVDESGDGGAYSVSGQVPEAQCVSTQIWVMASETFHAGFETLTRQAVGQCGTVSLDIELPDTGPGF